RVLPRLDAAVQPHQSRQYLEADGAVQDSDPLQLLGDPGQRFAALDHDRAALLLRGQARGQEEIGGPREPGGGHQQQRPGPATEDVAPRAQGRSPSRAEIRWRYDSSSAIAAPWSIFPLRRPVPRTPTSSRRRWLMVEVRRSS